MVWSCVRVEAPVSKEILSICMVCVECFQLLRPTELAIYVAFVFCHFVLVAPHPPPSSQVGGDASSDIPAAISQQRIFIELQHS